MPVDKVPVRIAWTLELLRLTGDEQVLEVGCGPGVAVSLLARGPGTGRITALDRSATAIKRTRVRAADHIATGRVVLEQTDLADLSAQSAAFDVVVGINVNVFWTSSATVECQVLRRVLRSDGRLLLVYEGPAPGGSRDVGDIVAATLNGQGLRADVIRHPSAPVVAITARPAG